MLRLQAFGSGRESDIIILIRMQDRRFVTYPILLLVQHVLNQLASKISLILAFNVLCLNMHPKLSFQLSRGRARGFL